MNIDRVQLECPDPRGLRDEFEQFRDEFERFREETEQFRDALTRAFIGDV